MGKVQKLFEQLQAVVEWLRCLAIVLLFGGSRLGPVSQISVALEFCVLCRVGVRVREREI
jgi:hypothetical protein